MGHFRRETETMSQMDILEIKFNHRDEKFLILLTGRLNKAKKKKKKKKKNQSTRR